MADSSLPNDGEGSDANRLAEEAHQDSETDPLRGGQGESLPTSPGKAPGTEGDYFGDGQAEGS
jgi:hypothetical protein